MSRGRLQPIIVGVADVKNGSRKVEDAIEPLELMLQSIHQAIKDTGLSESAASTFQSNIDSLDVIRQWTWPYPDLPSLIAKRLGIKPTRRWYSEHGGNQPVLLFNEAARRIALGENRLAVLTGGEALASLSACAAEKRLPPPGWTKIPEEVNSVFSPSKRELKESASSPGRWTPPRSGTNDIGVASKHSLGHPIDAYPLYENSFRAHRGQSFDENNEESAKMYAEFAQVAAKNPYAWFHDGPPETVESIGTVSKRNRMICMPYPLLMNTFNNVNLAAACILTSSQYAREIGIPEDRWIYPLGGASTGETNNLWERQDYWWSPSINRALDVGMEVAGIEKDDIDLYDFYSCFPIIPKLACEHLQIPKFGGPKQVTLLGGLTSFGGAGSNYSMHALAEMTRQLRADKGKTGLIMANGGLASYEAVVCLSRSPRRDGLPYPIHRPLPEVIKDVQIPPTDDEAEGEAVVETYTVEFNRDGSPLRAYIIGRLKSTGHRFIANHADESTLTEFCSQNVEPIGRSGKVRVGEDGRNLFTMHGELAKL